MNLSTPGISLYAGGYVWCCSNCATNRPKDGEKKVFPEASGIFYFPYSEVPMQRPLLENPYDAPRRLQKVLGMAQCVTLKKMLAQKALLSENIWTWLKHRGTHVPN
jgi:hypothetical protein